MNDHLHPLFRDILNSFVPKVAMSPQISWTRKNYRDGIQGTIQNTGYLEIEVGDDGNALSPPTVVTFWCDEPKPDIERQVDVLTVTVYGFTVHAAAAPRSIAESPIPRNLSSPRESVERVRWVTSCDAARTGSDTHAWRRSR